MIRRRLGSTLQLLILTAALAATPIAAEAQQRLDLPGVDRAALMREDAADPAAPGPLRFALPHDLVLEPDASEGWDRLPDGSHRWRLEVTAPGALSLNFGFSRFRLPWGGHLEITSRQGPTRRLTVADQRPDGALWTAVVLGDTALVSVVVPAGHRDDFELELRRVGRGYRFFGEPAPDKNPPGWCNIDVVCPEGDPWRAEIRSVGVYSINGYMSCTGAMINNTERDQTPLFLTAAHCGVNATNAATVVVYWNFESPGCGQLGGGSLDHAHLGGATWRAGSTATDFTLVELSELPDPAWQVTYAGWDRSGDVPTAAIAIHHPRTAVKCISFENDALEITSYLGYTSPGNGSHWRVVDWDLGTTEPGSSGSPLVDPAGRIIGQLHGGYAACGNNESDWYGRLSVSWDGGGTSTTRLRDWLDPAGIAPMALDLLDPLAAPPLVLDDLEIDADTQEARVSFTTQQPALVSLAYGRTAALELGEVDGDGYRTEHEFLLEGLLPATTYFYRVTARFEAGGQARSDLAEFHTASLVGRPRVAILPVRPNPARGESLTLEFWLAEAGAARLAVYDLRGRLAGLVFDEDRPQGSQTVVWEAAGRQAGAYVLRLESRGHAATAPFTLLR